VDTTGSDYSRSDRIKIENVGSFEENLPDPEKADPTQAAKILPVPIPV